MQSIHMLCKETKNLGFIIFLSENQQIFKWQKHKSSQAYFAEESRSVTKTQVVKNNQNFASNQIKHQGKRRYIILFFFLKSNQDIIKSVKHPIYIEKYLREAT